MTFTRNAEKEDTRLNVNGVELLEGYTPVPHGSLLFIKKLLFVDAEEVKM